MFRKGDTVNVYNTTLNRKAFLEGRATIMRPTGYTEDHYFVRFIRPEGKSANDVLGDPGYSRRGVERFVYPGDAQTDPNAYLAAKVLGSAPESPGAHKA